ncbi:MAG: DUF4132 domain-containing protein [Lachnospiraceae bacterium]|nr:DUF4132 domain-containing protein [Lachnospiraceae bacterium]
MINPRDQRITKMVELFEQMNLFTADELTLIEDYLTGAAEEQELEKLTFRDLSGVPQDVVNAMVSLFTDLVNKGREEKEKLANILFTAGQSTSSNLFPSNYIFFNKKETVNMEIPKKVTLFAERAGMNEYQISRYSIQKIIEISENTSENVRKALEYQKSKLDNGKVLVLTTYFRMKYRNLKLVEKGTEEKNGGILAGVSKILGGKSSEKEEVVQIDTKDMELLKQYEDILVSSICNLYKKQMPRLELDEITNAVNNDRVDGRILKMAHANLPVDRFMLCILGGTAFVNYKQSVRLKNVLKICIAANPKEMLNIMDNMDLRGELNQNGGDYDEVFGIDSRKYIIWAAEKMKTGILNAQFKRNREVYLDCMNAVDFDAYNRMNAVIQKLDPSLYNAKKATDIHKQQTKVIDAILQVLDPAVKNVAGDYLNGTTEIETLYAYEDKLELTGYRWGGRHWNILQSYQRGYGYDELSDRCEALLMLCGGYANTGGFRDGTNIKTENVERTFASVNARHLGLKYQLKGYADAYDAFYLDRWKNTFEAVGKKIFLGYLQERREEMTAAFQGAGSTGRVFGLLVLSEDRKANKEAILSFSQDSAKTVKEALLNILYQEKAWEEDVKKLLSSKKAGEREIAVRVLTEWDSKAYQEILTEALEKEKNGKVRTLLETVLHVGGGESESGSRTLTREDLVKEAHKGNKKRGLAWAYETPFSKVHTKAGEEAQEEYLQAVLLSYSSMSPCGVSPSAAALAETLDEKELAIYVNELFDKWMEAGAESKKRWVLYAAAIHGGDEIVTKLHHQIQEWPQAARGAIASEAVQALALNPKPQALLIVDGISRKFKFKQIKAAAGKALDFAASQLGITTEELADRIVPDLGFDENMERCFDYGERKFTVTITTALEVEVFDESGKKLKNLPSPGKKDDEEKAKAAYEEFKQMKKQMKATVSSQKMRLEMALSTGRQWSVEAWKNLFVKNPVMHQFATGLIWGIYEDRKLVSTFRYMEDGSFNTEDEDEFELPEGGEDSSQYIGIVHPIELTEDTRKAWKEQLEDYEITQPIEQLDRTVYYRTKEEENEKSLERFGGCIVNDLSLGGKLQTLGWYRGSVQDAGGFYSYYREDKELAMGVELHFSGSFVGGQNEDVTVYEARFYSLEGTVVNEKGEVVPAGIRRGSYVYDEANDQNSCFLKEVPERYFSEVVLQLAKATASSKEKNVNWKSVR